MIFRSARVEGSTEHIVRCSIYCPHSVRYDSCECGGVMMCDDNGTPWREIRDQALQQGRRMIEKGNLTRTESALKDMIFHKELFDLRWSPLEKMSEQEGRSRAAWILAVLSAQHVDLDVEFAHGNFCLRVTLLGHSRLCTISDEHAMFMLKHKETAGANLVPCTYMCPNGVEDWSGCFCGGSYDTPAIIKFSAKAMAKRAAQLLSDIPDPKARFLLGRELEFLLTDPHNLPERERDCRAYWLLEALILLKADYVQVWHRYDQNVTYMRIGPVLRRKDGYNEIIGYTKPEPTAPKSEHLLICKKAKQDVTVVIAGRTRYPQWYSETYGPLERVHINQ